MSDRGVRGEITQVIRPAAVVPEMETVQIVQQLEQRDVSRGGVWNASATLWQRYSGPWDGPANSRGSAVLVGTIAVTYGSPVRHHMTIYRATVTAAGQELGWTVEKLCDEALGYGDLTLAGCPRADMLPPPGADPFKQPTDRSGET